MISFSSPEAVDAMNKRLGNIRRDFAEVEIEELVVYGDLEDRLIGPTRIAVSNSGHPAETREVFNWP